jgi:AraC-like DNA-binding protein
MGSSGGTILAVSSRALVEACAHRNVDVDALLAAVGLDRSQLDDHDARIPTDKARALWQRAYEVAGDPNLALHAVEALPYGAYRVLDFIASSAATVGEVFSKVSDYFPLVNTTVALPIAVGDAEVGVGIVPAPGSPAVSRPYAEYTLAACYLRIRNAVGDFDPMRVEFSHETPADTSEHERIFRSPVLFRCRETRLVLSRSVWDQPNTHPDPELCAVLEEHARRLLSEVPRGGFGEEVRKTTLAQLRGGTPTLAHVAQQLGMSGRTLQRRLEEEGTSFAELLDELRRGTAQAYLADPQVSIGEVSYLLGFSEQSAFQRAFKRWTGLTPRGFRNSL